ncbi:MAG TPA: peptidoglycan glycosyltransferase, partial [Marinilabiliaceae bacterium]|nr:peptidoglycan glycosyltransferase [Marinilabiliaceae bacterium]
MVGAYTAFPNYGRAVEPVIILSIETAGGELIYKAGETRFHNEAYNEESARLIIQMLREVIERGTGHALYSRYNLQGDYGGKTGTTQNNVDGWFIGFTPDIVAGAWVGAENPGIRFQSTALGQGAHTALPIFARFMQQTEKSSQHKYIAGNRFYPLPEELQNKLNCEDYLEDYRPREEMGFFERLFGSPERQKPSTEAEQDSLLEERNRKVLQRMRDIFRKREE